MEAFHFRNRFCAARMPPRWRAPGMQIILQPTVRKVEMKCTQRNISFATLGQSPSAPAVPTLYYVQFLADVQQQTGQER